MMKFIMGNDKNEDVNGVFLENVNGKVRVHEKCEREYSYVRW